MKNKAVTGGGKKIALSNLEKVMYPETGFTNGQVINYYTEIARYILPHLKNRPITSKRFPNGVAGEYFYEKDAPSFTPGWVKTFSIPRTSEKSLINYILITDLATLIWSANKFVRFNRPKFRKNCRCRRCRMAQQSERCCFFDR